MPRKDYEAGANRIVNKQFFLKYISNCSGTVAHYGPWPSEMILTRFYDEFAEFLKTKGELDSVAVSHTKVKDLENLSPPGDWMEMLDSILGDQRLEETA